MKKKIIVPLFLTLTLVSAVSFAVQVFNSSDSNLGNFAKFKCGNGMSCAETAGKLLMASTGAMENGETMVNSTDDSVSFLSDDSHATVQVRGFEAKNASLELAADQSDDTGDSFFLKADTSNVFSILSEATTLATMSTVGDWTFSGTTPYLTVGDDGAEDAGLVFDEASLNFNISVDSSAGTLVLGKGTAAGTTDAIRIDTNQDVTFVQNVV